MPNELIRQAVRYGTYLLVSLNLSTAVARDTYSSYSACKRVGEPESYCATMPGGKRGPPLQSGQPINTSVEGHTSGSEFGTPGLPITSGWDLKLHLGSWSTTERMEGVGYVHGLIDGRPDDTACIPLDVPKDQIVATVYKHLLNLGIEINEPAPRIVIGILRQNWPCKTSTPLAEDVATTPKSGVPGKPTARSTNKGKTQDQGKSTEQTSPF